MSTRTGAAGTINGAATAASGVDATTTGVKTTYTCPAGKQALVRFVSVSKLVGAITVAIEAVIGATTVQVSTLTTQQQFNCAIPLNAGDKVQLDVTVAVAVTGAFDALIGAEEYSAA